MLSVNVPGRKTKESALRAVVIRADGTREDLGVISYYHRNPLKRLTFWFKAKVLRRRVA